jgi:hypothetical protein
VILAEFVYLVVRFRDLALERLKGKGFKSLTLYPFPIPQPERSAFLGCQTTSVPSSKWAVRIGESKKVKEKAIKNLSPFPLTF